jgi:hypothetical protein
MRTGFIGSIFTGSDDENWTNLANWVSSARDTATVYPTQNTLVTIENDCFVDVDAEIWVEPSAIDVGEYNISFNSTQEPRPVITCDITATTGNITFNGVDYGAPLVRIGSIFKGTVDSDWYNIANWVTTGRLPATELPANVTIVSLEGDCVVDVDNENWLQPASISITSHNITFNSVAEVRPVITCDITATTGTVFFNGVDYGA